MLDMGFSQSVEDILAESYRGGKNCLSIQGIFHSYLQPQLIIIHEP